MKTTAFKLTILFILCCILQTNAQEQTISLQMEEGYEYIYELTVSSNNLYHDYKTKYSLIHNKKIRLVIEKVIPNEEIILWAKIEQNNFTNKIGEYATQWDYIFPDFYGYSPNIEEELFSALKFRFSLNLRENTVNILNAEELLEEFHSKKNQILDLKKKDESLKSRDREKLNEQTKLVEFLLWFHNKPVNSSQLIKSKFIEESCYASIGNNGRINFNNNDLIDIVPDIRVVDCWINPKNGLLLEYSIIKQDTIRASHGHPNRLRTNETHVKLIISREIPKNMLYISGKIENPLSDRITVSFLSKPFGYDVFTKTIQLDENGRFETTVNYDHKGFVYVINENKNQHKEDAQLVFYALPGDSLIFDAKGVDYHWEIAYKGQHAKEAELIHKIRNESKIFQERIVGGALIYYFPFLHTKFDYRQFSIALKEVEKTMSEHKKTIGKESYDFINSEFQNLCYTGIYSYLSLFFGSKTIGINQYLDTTFRNEYEKLVQNHDVHIGYNDYGIYSRYLTSKYLIYNFAKAKKVNRESRTATIFGANYGNKQLIGFVPMVLSGKCLYRETAYLLTRILSGTPGVELPRFSPDDNFAIEQLEKLRTRCNNNTFNDEIETVLHNQLSWQNENHVPEITFLNQQKEKAFLSDYFGEKPTIFYITNHWSAERYTFDNLCKKVPEANFVLIVEGSNFEVWKDYMSRAEPIADQLLLRNDSLSLKDVFLTNTQLYVVYDKSGKLLGNKKGLSDAIKLAKGSLKETETDKSTLKLIIFILGIFITFLVLVFLIWRMRVKQRFRKEQQTRKLRELELTAIRAQMNPHFLFNSLNSVQNLIQQNRAQEAHLYLSDFAGLIRKVLRNSDIEEISLAEELEMIKQYLHLEQLRFDFDLSIQVDESVDTNNTMIPSMLLQPFVENAVIHGLQNKTGKGTVLSEKNGSLSKLRSLYVTVSKATEGVLIVIEDNGIGRKAAQKIAAKKNGKGTNLMKERLEMLGKKYGENYQLKIIDIDENDKLGTRVEIYLPEEH